MKNDIKNKMMKNKYQKKEPVQEQMAAEWSI